MKGIVLSTLELMKAMCSCTHTCTHVYHMQAEAFPALAPIIPLLPENFLVSYTDIIPGLRRFDGEGQLSISTKQCINTLAGPMLSPVHSYQAVRALVCMPYLEPRQQVGCACVGVLGAAKV
eukprot:1160249-Pelagomonas_calceolata.AAC.2